MTGIKLLDLLGTDELSEFKVAATYSEPLDEIVYLEEDVGYVSQYIGPRFEILWHPHEMRPVGLKICGIRELMHSRKV